MTFSFIKSVKGLPAGLAVIIALGVGFAGGVMKAKKNIQYVEVPATPMIVIQSDTLYVEKPVVRYITKSTIDTVVVEREIDPAGFQVLASTTQKLDSEGTNYGSVDVEYLMPPWDEFHISFNPAPLPVVVKTETIHQVQYVSQPLKYYEKRWFNFAIGLGFGAVMTKYYADHK